jgi:probable FeS assembly SUF system protein SufT
MAEKPSSIAPSSGTAETDTECALKREVVAAGIPSGSSALLPAGTKVRILNRLGGNFTIESDYGMFRINGSEADALGETPPPPGSAPAGNTDAYGSTGAAEHPGHSGPPDEAAVWEQLKTVFDPEIPVNIVDLGLVYSLTVSPLENESGKYKAVVAMTLTAPGCGMGPVIAEDARNRILTVPGVHEARVEIVWEPPWTSEMISEEGKMELGLV